MVERREGESLEEELEFFKSAVLMYTREESQVRRVRRGKGSD